MARPRPRCKRSGLTRRVPHVVGDLDSLVPVVVVGPGAMVVVVVLEVIVTVVVVVTGHVVQQGHVRLIGEVNVEHVAVK